jgi:hypothetical protein
MLEGNIAGRINSWCICWHASCFLKAMLTLYPARSLVQNIGFDGSASDHSGKSALYVDLATDSVPVKEIDIKEEFLAREAVKVYFRKTGQSPPSPAQRIVRRMVGAIPPRIKFLIESVLSRSTKEPLKRLSRTKV